jgi:hypothetical protein
MFDVSLNGNALNFRFMGRILFYFWGKYLEITMTKSHYLGDTHIVCVNMSWRFSKTPTSAKTTSFYPLLQTKDQVQSWEESRVTRRI